MQLSSANRICDWTEENNFMFEEDRKIYGDCKFYAAEICGTESV